MDDATLADRMVDFLIKTHLYRQDVAHPFPPGFPEDNKILSLYSLSEYGRWALYRSFEDTTTVRVRVEP